MKKLVRDRIPEIVEQEGRKYKVEKCATKADKIWWLKEKLMEESLEFLHSEDFKELGDILDVIQALINTMHLNPSAIKAHRDKKAWEKGKFKEGYIIDFGRELS